MLRIKLNLGLPHTKRALQYLLLGPSGIYLSKEVVVVIKNCPVKDWTIVQYPTEGRILNMHIANLDQSLALHMAL